MAALLGQDEAGFKLMAKLYHALFDALWIVANRMEPLGDMVLKEMLESATTGVRRVHEARQDRVKTLTSRMTEFPMLVSPRLEDRDNLLMKLHKLGVGRELPNLKPIARYKRDEFNDAAEAIIAQMTSEGFEVLELARRGWDTFRKHLRSYVIPRFFEDPKNKQLEATLRSEIKGRSGTKAIRDRVIERIADRVHSALGLKGRNGIGAAP